MATKKLQAGDLDRKLDLFAKDTHKNGKGEKIGESSSPFAANVPCRKRETGGVETGGNGAGSAQATRETAFSAVEFDLRYRTGVLETMILYCEGVRYDILNVREGSGRKQWLIIEAQKHD